VERNKCCPSRNRHKLTQTLENRERKKGAQNGIRERDFSLFCCTFYFHFSKHLFSYFISLCVPHPPLVSLSLFYRSTSKATFRYTRKFSVRRKLYKCVCLYSRQAAAVTSVWILAASFSVVIGIAASSPLYLTPASNVRALNLGNQTAEIPTANFKNKIPAQPCKQFLVSDIQRFIHRFVTLTLILLTCRIR